MSKANMYCSYKEDMVSICVFCKEDGTVLLNYSIEGNISQFPSMSVVQSSWRLTVKKLISSIPELSGKENSIVRVTKFWLPDSAPVCHVLYKVRCPLSEKKLIKMQGRSKWYTLDQAQQLSLSGELSSPELLEYIAQSLQLGNICPITTDPETSKEGFDILHEVLEKNIMIETEVSILTLNEQLLKAAHFFKNEQRKIYKEFWLRTFPNILMNQLEFDRFVSELGWKREEWPGLFTCADVTARGGITFREFLLFLAATEPETPHGSSSGKVRCQYIFRYFDKNRDNVLDQNELKTLIIAIATAKGQSIREVEKSIAELGLGSKQRLSLDTFTKKVGDLKFRGTSTIFRSKISVLKFVPTIPLNESSNPLPVTQQNSKKQGFFPLSIHWGETAGKTQSNNDITTWNNKPGNKDFEIATHVIKVTRAGVIEEVKPVDKVAQGKSGSMGHYEQFIRFTSLQYYDEKNPLNELLKSLEYFATETPSSLKLHKKAYTWGQFDMGILMNHLLSICEKCIKVLEKEPRMLQICSPVYIMGDIHGNFHDLRAFEQVLWNLGLSLSPCSLLFLGDYVDRGAYGVEVVAYLFAQKVKNPNKVFLLRGNHEIRNIQKNFTFYHECLRKFGDDNFHDVWNTINRVFDVMPLVAVVDTKLFCCHGGIPPPWLCPRIEQINSIPCPLALPEDESMLAWEIMWNDPFKSEQMTAATYQEMEANEGFAFNTIRKTGRFFSIEALETFLKRNDLKMVIRAHEVRSVGFQVQQGGKLLTVFSSSGYCGGTNEAACIFVSQENKIRILRIDTS